MPRRGRPRKEVNNDSSETILQEPPKDSHQYIQQDYYLIKLFRLIALQSRYRTLIQTGREKKNEIQNVKACKKTTKVNSKLQEMMKKLQLEKYYVFFLRGSWKYSLVNDEIIDNTEYQKIEGNFSEKLSPLIGKLNILIKQLNNPCITILVEILKLYDNKMNQGTENDQIISEILGEIREPYNLDKFKYLLDWEQLKTATQEDRVEQQIKLIQGQIDKLNEITSEKVIEKNKQIIDKLEKSISKQKEERRLGCLEYFIKKLICIFTRIVEDPTNQSD